MKLKICQFEALPVPVQAPLKLPCTFSPEHRSKIRVHISQKGGAGPAKGTTFKVGVCALKCAALVRKECL